MKKLFLTIACVLSVFAASAQKWYVGPQVSLNLTGLSRPSDFSTSTRVGYAFGAFGGYEFNKLIGIEAQLLYSSQGQKLSVGWDEYSLDATKKLNYINIPIVVKFDVVKGLNIFAGPQFGFNVRSKLKLENNNGGVVDVWNIDTKDATNVFDFGGIIGVAYQFKFGLRAGISYYQGFTNTVSGGSIEYQGEKISYSDFGDPSKNKVFAITVGWRF